MKSNDETLQTAIQFHQAGRLDDAEKWYRIVLRTNPKCSDAQHLLGLVEYQRGRSELALPHIRRALAGRPASAAYLNSLGAVCRALGQLDEAQSAFERSIQIQPQYADPYNNLGTLLFAKGRFDEAEQVYQKALALKPEFVDAFVNLGSLQHALHRYDEAESSLRQALRLAPQNPLAWNNLGNVYKSRERLQEAADSYQSALRADPNYGAAWNNLAVTLQAQGRWEAAVEAFDKSSQLNSTAGLAIKRALALPVILDSTEQLMAARARFDGELDRLLTSTLRIDDPLREAGVGVFHLAYHGIDDRDRYIRVAEMFSRAAPSLNYVAPHCHLSRPDPTRAHPLRVGFISHFFHNHSVGRHYGGLVRHLPRERCRVVLLRFPGSGDDMAGSIAAGADEVVTLPPDLAQAREQIAALGLDVLYYTDIGMDPLTYFLAFARLARVQCVTCGHPVTSGVKALDYFVSWDPMEPAGAEAHYSERLVRMRNITSFYERPQLSAEVLSRADFGLAPDWHVYLCTQNLCKLHPDFDPLLGEILRRDPQGRVILFHGADTTWSERLADRLKLSIPDVAERVGFLPHQRNDRFLHLLTLADAVLDSIHFCGGTTTVQCLGVGAPIVTLPGEFMRGRWTAGCYQAMGLADCVARDADDYVRIAVRLGTDPAYRASIRAAILGNNAILYSNLNFVRELEEFFVQAVAGRMRLAA
jgi:predicted O-linked N-acetylglucosamine transferase (SPINDLY family)